MRDGGDTVISFAGTEMDDAVRPSPSDLLCVLPLQALDQLELIRFSMIFSWLLLLWLRKLLETSNWFQLRSSFLHVTILGRRGPDWPHLCHFRSIVQYTALLTSLLSSRKNWRESCCVIRVWRILWVFDLLSLRRRKRRGRGYMIKLLVCFCGDCLCSLASISISKFPLYASVMLIFHHMWSMWFRSYNLFQWFHFILGFCLISFFALFQLQIHICIYMTFDHVIALF